MRGRADYRRGNAALKKGWVGTSPHSGLSASTACIIHEQRTVNGLSV